MAFAATLAAPLSPYFQFRFVNWPLFCIDATLLAALVGLALVADRFWPMWLAAVQLVTVAGHALRAYDAAILPSAYWIIVVRASYLMLLILLLATIRHRERLQHGLPEHDWTRGRQHDPLEQCAPGPRE